MGWISAVRDRSGQMDGGARGWFALACGAVTNAYTPDARTGETRLSRKKADSGGSAPGLPLTNLIGSSRPERISRGCALPRGSATASPCRAVVMPAPPEAAVAEAVASDWTRHNSDSSSRAIRPEQAAFIGEVNGLARFDAIKRRGLRTLSPPYRVQPKKESIATKRLSRAQAQDEPQRMNIAGVRP
ncbi:hypothetical protein MESS4_660075 [Mesorhizobium sp. STM 4661]|nr:hypothetical protein MESS4_660075 [Mesorhizobium sp. STM 4661]